MATIGPSNNIHELFLLFLMLVIDGVRLGNGDYTWLRFLCDDYGMADSIYWYDFETTGTDPVRDRVIQFAGVRTDLDLNATGEPVNLLCSPGNDTVPEPEAMLVTGISYSHILQHGLNEAALSKEILDNFAQPGTCVAGFNNIRFDDEFNRYLMYRNFHDPYAREWQNGNSRWDVIDLFRMAHALRPDGFNWPTDEQGTATFRLEKLTEANDIGHESAHDAVADVLATIQVTRKLRTAQPKLYAYLYGLRQKQAVVRQLYPLGKNAIVHVSSMYPAKQSCVAVVLPICAHPTNNNGVICFDLSHDPQALIDVDPPELHRRVFTSRAELGDTITRIPLKTIYINRCPAIAPLSTIRGHESRLEINVDDCLKNQKRLQKASGTVEKIEQAYLQTQFEQSQDPDFMLYQGGFFSVADREVMDELRLTRMEDLAAFDVRLFKDKRLPEMLFRYRARNFPGSLSTEERTRWDEFRRERLSDTKVVVSRLNEIESLRQSGRGGDCLDDLESYLLGLKQDLQE